MGSTQTSYKIVVVGMQGAGKTSYCRLLTPIVRRFSTDAFNHFDFRVT